MVRSGTLGSVLIAALVMPATACSLLVDSDVGVRGDGAPGGSDGAPGGSDGATTGTGDAPDCPVLPGFPPFLDDFSTDDLDWAIDPKIQRDGAASIQAGVESGALRFSPANAGPDNAWVKSVEFDILTGRIAVRVPMLTTDTQTEAYVALLGPGAVHKFRYDGTDLHVPGGTVVHYSPDAHVWWQIRSEDYYLHFETSQDGVDWTELDSVPLDFDPTQARIEIGVSVAAPSDAYRGQFAVDDLNLPPCR